MSLVSVQDCALSFSLLNFCNVALFFQEHREARPLSTTQFYHLKLYHKPLPFNGLLSDLTSDLSRFSGDWE